MTWAMIHGARLNRAPAVMGRAVRRLARETPDDAERTEAILRRVTNETDEPRA